MHVVSVHCRALLFFAMFDAPHFYYMSQEPPVLAMRAKDLGQVTSKVRVTVNSDIF
jgi:hypothetical protein